MRLLLVSVIAGAALLAGCKPPKFDQTITCPGFHAAHVAVYGYSDTGMFAVLYPDYSLVKVDKTECVVTRER